MIINNSIDRAKKYLAKIEPSISGSGGHNKLYVAAVALVQGFELEAESAVNILLEDFNPRCNPEWTIPEIRHKVNDALKADIGNKTRGWLLEGKKQIGAINTPPRQCKPVERQPEAKTPAVKKKDDSFTREDKPDRSNWRIIQSLYWLDGGISRNEFYWNGDFYQSRLTGKPDSKGRVLVENYIYLYDDGEGTPYLMIHRLKWNDNSKKTPIYHFDKALGRYIAGRGNLPPVPFNAVEVKESSVIHFVEGEKCACALRAFFGNHGVEMVDNAVTTSGGSTSWNDSLIPWFINKDIVIYPDNDEAGKKYLQKVAKALAPVTNSIRFIQWEQDFPEKGDIVDYLKTLEKRSFEQ